MTALILTLFIVLLILSFAIILTGYFTDIPVFILVGCAFLFLLGILTFNGTVLYETGQNISISHSYNPDGSLDVTSADTDYQYVAFSDSTSHSVGVFLAAAALLGFGIAVANLRAPRGMRD